MHGTVSGDHRRKRKGGPGQGWDETVVYEAKKHPGVD